ncbi:related to HSE1-Class E vacuolar protein-sorting machinery protein [Sporisorium reilianum f. sp. reilianum]|uniref:Class E vacuolar protein-sorting machinery protein HSE1 n=1 Tax=Sporisorium reilianum f. sp. reilianum TaxID=72559 RepID=A0A2N8UIA9_9BASI|nr:related to HSE1-Class E vacuolar protein-sorting machinery protein [Sporisorium reilianum f. sp. reilianum]
MFTAKNPFEDIVLKATSDELTSENWELNLEVCDKVSSGGEAAARNCVGAIQKRLVHRNANVQLYALTLADAVAKNCGLTAHQEIASRSFTQTLARICLDRNTHATVKKRCSALVKEWAGEFDDESLGLMKETYESLKSQDAVAEDDAPATQQPREPTSEQLRAEDEELRRALELSIQDQGGRSAWNSYSTQQAEASGSSAPAAATSSSSYAQPPTSQSSAAPAQQHSTYTNGASSSAPSAQPAAAAATPAVASRVRALYDFSPTEPGELAFSRGEIIRVLDSVYEHWWRGEVRGEAGIFPVNYVEVLPDPTPAELQREAEMEARIFSQAADIDRLLNKLRSLDPARDNLAEDEELQELYQKSLAMRPKIVKLIDRYSNKITELKAMNDKFVHARGSFDEMMEQSLSRYNPGGHSSQDYLRPRPELQQQVSTSSADYAQQSAYPNAHAYPMQQAPSVANPHDQSQYPYNVQQQQHAYPQSAGPGQVDLGYSQGSRVASGAQPQQHAPLAYQHAPHEQQYTPTPHDDEKRRLFERARAESEAFQQQHFQSQAHPSGSGYSGGYPAQATDPSGLNQQMGNMNIGGSSSYASHPVGH